MYKRIALFPFASMVSISARVLPNKRILITDMRQGISSELLEYLSRERQPVSRLFQPIIPKLNEEGSWNVLFSKYIRNFDDAQKSNRIFFLNQDAYGVSSNVSQLLTWLRLFNENERVLVVPDLDEDAEPFETMDIDGVVVLGDEEAISLQLQNSFQNIQDLGQLITVDVVSKNVLPRSYSKPEVDEAIQRLGIEEYLVIQPLESDINSEKTAVIHRDYIHKAMEYIGRGVIPVKENDKYGSQWFYKAWSKSDDPTLMISRYYKTGSESERSFEAAYLLTSDGDVPKINFSIGFWKNQLVPNQNQVFQRNMIDPLQDSDLFKDDANQIETMLSSALPQVVDNMIKRSFSNDLTVLLSSSYEVDQLQGITQLFWQKELDPQHAERLAELYQNKLDHKVFEMIQKNLMEAINTSKSSLFLTRFFTSLSLDHILHFVKQENPSPFNGYQTGYVRFFYCNPDSCLRQDHILLDERLQNERLYRLVQINTEMSLHHFLLDKEEINALNEQFKELETLSPQRLVLFLLSSVNENELIRDFSINQILAQSDQHGLEFSSIAQAIEGGSGSLVMDKIFEYLKDAD